MADLIGKYPLNCRPGLAELTILCPSQKVGDIIIPKRRPARSLSDHRRFLGQPSARNSFAERACKWARKSVPSEDNSHKLEPATRTAKCMNLSLAEGLKQFACHLNVKHVAEGSFRLSCRDPGRTTRHPQGPVDLRMRHQVAVCWKANRHVISPRG
jgi:hypothetical protein